MKGLLVSASAHRQTQKVASDEVHGGCGGMLNFCQPASEPRHGMMKTLWQGAAGMGAHQAWDENSEFPSSGQQAWEFSGHGSSAGLRIQLVLEFSAHGSRHGNSMGFRIEDLLSIYWESSRPGETSRHWEHSRPGNSVAMVMKRWNQWPKQAMLLATTSMCLFYMLPVLFIASLALAHLWWLLLSL